MIPITRSFINKQKRDIQIKQNLYLITRTGHFGHKHTITNNTVPHNEQTVNSQYISKETYYDFMS